MPIPDFQTAMLPLLRDLAGGVRSTQETFDALAVEFALTPEELRAQVPSGNQSLMMNRIAWAKSHLKGAGLIESPRRGTYRLTARGHAVLSENPPAITMAYLKQFPEYIAYRTGHVSTDTSAPAASMSVETQETRTPDDLLADGFTQHRSALVGDLRERVSAMPPARFEQLVVDLLMAMGYGGAQADAGMVVGGSGDEGIDGLVREDKLGLETIYVQAKRWQGVVGRPEIQRFAGALQGQRARKGVFITTSYFTKEALAYSQSIQTTIVLIDGAQLAELMIDHGVGVSTAKVYEIKRIDSDYFLPE